MLICDKSHDKEKIYTSVCVINENVVILRHE